MGETKKDRSTGLSATSSSTSSEPRAKPSGSRPNGGRPFDQLKAERDPMRDHGPTLPLIEPRHKRTKGGGLGWLLHEGLDIFEAKVLAFRETGEPISARTDKKILDMIAGPARNDGVMLTVHMIRKARQRLGYKAFEKQVKPFDKAQGEPVAAPAAGEPFDKAQGKVVSDVEIAAHDVDIAGAPQSPVVRVEGQTIVRDKVVTPGRVTLLKGLRWDEKIMAEAIERLASGLPPSSKDEEVVMRAIRAQVEAVTMAASPKLHGMLCMFPDGLKEYMRCVFKVVEALAVEEEEPKVSCFGSWHRMNTADCKGCKVWSECFKISLNAQMERAEEVHKADLEGKVSPLLMTMAPETCLEYRPNPDGVCAIAGCNLRKRPGMRCDFHGRIFPVAKATHEVGASPNLQEMPVVTETATAPTV